MRRLTIAFSSSVVLVLALAGIALAWAPPSLDSDCAPNENEYAWKITFSQDEPNFKIDLAWTEDGDPFDTIDFGADAHLNGPHSFTTPRGGSTLWVSFHDDGNAKDSAAANGDLCEPPEGEPSVDLDKFVWDEGGLVTHVEEGTAVTYTYEVTNDGETNLDIALLEDLIVSSPGADSGDIACDDFERQLDNPGNDDDVFEPEETWVFTCTVEGLPVGQTDNEACVYANVAAPAPDLAPVTQVYDPRESDVDSCAEYSITVTEGDTGGGEGTPEGGSIPDTATSLSSQSNPLLTLIFGLAMISALGGLAFVNVRASNRR